MAQTAAAAAEEEEEEEEVGVCRNMINGISTFSR